MDASGISLNFATPMSVSSTDECSWYHTFDLPNGTVVRATWDHRECVDDYLGQFDFTGRSVLEIGPASGFLTVSMERRGATVTSVENSPDELWEFVPRTDRDVARWIAGRKTGSPRLFKSWWLTQKLFGCSAKIAYCGVAALPALVSKLKFDVCFIGGVLQHVRHPFDVLWVASMVADNVIVTERFLPEVEESRPLVRFVPAPDNDSLDTWFYLSSAAIKNALQIFGFDVLREKQFVTRAWSFHDPDIRKDSYKESPHLNLVFRRKAVSPALESSRTSEGR
jgi:hypothetical protein